METRAKLGSQELALCFESELLRAELRTRLHELNFALFQLLDQREAPIAPLTFGQKRRFGMSEAHPETVALTKQGAHIGGKALLRDRLWIRLLIFGAASEIGPWIDA